MKNSFIIFTIMLLLFLLATGCSGTDSVEPYNSTNTYLYIGYNLNKKIITKGTMTITTTQNTIIGQRNLKDIYGNIDTGYLDGNINSDGTFNIYFDPHKVKGQYTSLIGNKWSSYDNMAGIIFSFSGTGIWADTTGTFLLLQKY